MTQHLCITSTVSWMDPVEDTVLLIVRAALLEKLVFRQILTWIHLAKSCLPLHNSDWESWHCEVLFFCTQGRRGRKKKKKPLLTFGEIGQETNIYVFGAFGRVVFFLRGEFLLEAEGCRKNTNVLLNQAWAVGKWICLQTGRDECESDQTHVVVHIIHRNKTDQKSLFQSSSHTDWQLISLSHWSHLWIWVQTTRLQHSYRRTGCRRSIWRNTERTWLCISVVAASDK